MLFIIFLGNQFLLELVDKSTEMPNKPSQTISHNSLNLIRPNKKGVLMQDILILTQEWTKKLNHNWKPFSVKFDLDLIWNQFLTETREKGEEKKERIKYENVNEKKN